MHELSVCQGLLNQVERIARDHEATRVDVIVLSVGPLAGIDGRLLQRAFEIARTGTVAHDARLEIERGEVVVECRQCGENAEVPANRLLCPQCGDWRVTLSKGDELLLTRLEIRDTSDA